MLVMGLYAKKILCQKLNRQDKLAVSDGEEVELNIIVGRKHSNATNNKLLACICINE
jgi:hypothetical protein